MLVSFLSGFINPGSERVGRAELTQRRSLTLATGVILLAVIVGVVTFSQQQSESFALNEELTEFLDSQLGEVVVLDIMNTDCPACIVEVQHLREFFRQYGDEVVLVSLSIEFGVFSQDTDSRVAQFKRENGVDWPLLIYEGATDVIRRFNVYGIPTTVVLDAEGEIVFQATRIVGSEELAGVVEPLLSGV
ncbi:MAG: TlpA family protein disulfide reductase [Thermoplasmata archaeon]